MRIQIDGTVTSKQSKQHIPHTFSMPAGASKLSIHLEYSPQRATGQLYDNMLCLTLFDPHGCRGARHNNPDQSLTITEYSATPGYTPGALQVGTWTLFMDTHRILLPDSVHYKLEIDISKEPLNETAAQWIKAKVKSRGPGWYRGDLHGHTLHSDASWDVPEFVAYARSYKLDFATLTDHNTVSALTHLDHLAGDDLLTMGGSELTSYYGHALALGVRQWQEWRVGINNITDINAITGVNKITMPDIALQVKGKGGVFVIAHPKSVGDPDCTGCDWHYSDMMPGVARHIEVWNGPWSGDSGAGDSGAGDSGAGDSGAGDSGNQRALELWYSWLNQGYRMVATAGTDIHGPMSDPNPGFNTVYANDLTELAILGAIKCGHLYLSSGPKLELSASNQQGPVMMGDLITGDNLMLSLKWHDCLSDDVLKIIIDGVVVNLHQLSESGSLEWPLPHQGRWCTVEVRGKNGHMRALTNPIFAAPTSQWH